MTNAKGQEIVKEFDPRTLKKQLIILKQKMTAYLKEISVSILQELLSQKQPVSKQSQRAGRCICLLLNAFYEYPSFKEF